MLELAVSPSLLYSRLVVVLLTIPWLVKVYLSGLDFMHILQLEGYKNQGFSDWIKRHPHRVFPQRERLYGKVLLLGGVISWLLNPSQALIFFPLVWLVLVFLSIYKRDRRKSKKPLVLTKRTVRLLTFFKFIFLLEVVFFFWLFYQPSAEVPPWGEVYIGRSILFFWVFYVLGMLAPYNLKLANSIIRPLEELINAWYFRKAKRLIRKFSDLTVVGITGSYGKTSTKFIAHGVLSQQYHSLTTPESYNTPMGISKVVNSELKEEHQYFVVEMGARYRGDIKELCELASPKIGILTAIGTQHLETFGNQETIYQTKKELADALPPDGILIINGDDPNCVKVAESLSIKVIRYGIKEKNLDFKASYIKTTSVGLYFRLKNQSGETFKIQSRLLGRHSVYNLLAGFALGTVCGMEGSRIVSALAKIDAIPHRLQLRHSQGGATIIDDAYNANPTGAANALAVLGEFKTGQKILVTPGFVEMGGEEERENREFGKKAAVVCDWVFLVGEKKTEAIRKGLVAVGFDTSRLEVVNHLEQVTKRLKQIVRMGDVILFENDLPDQYTEEI
jgi:UDP-N-acetylmuramoyl-tripeptide--D-alanyl-D-alanine ligase